MELTVDEIAFGTTVALAACTGGSVWAAASATTRTATIAYSILSGGFAGASLGSISAYLDQSSTNVRNYFTNLRYHSGVAIAGFYQFATQAMAQGLINGIVDGVRAKI